MPRGGGIKEVRNMRIRNSNTCSCCKVTSILGMQRISRPVVYDLTSRCKDWDDYEIAN